MEIVSGMFRNILAFAYQNKISFIDVVRIIDYVILSAEVDTDKEWDLAKLLECEKALNGVLRMVPMSQWENQYNLFKPAYKVLQDEPEKGKAYREYKLKNYTTNYKHIVTMAEEYKKTITGNV